MNSPVKYTFDQAFDGGAKSRFELEIEELKSEAEQSAQSSYERGVQEGRAQVLGEIEAETLATMQQVSASTQSLFESQAHLEARIKRESIDLAYSIASKLSSALMRSHPLAEIQSVIENCLEVVSRQPRLVIRVADTVQESVSEKLEAMKTAANFSGDIILISEPTLGKNDCRVEWPDGGTERNQQAIQREIENAVHHYAASGTSETSDAVSSEHPSVSEAI